jgi:hypothetical protein
VNALFVLHPTVLLREHDISKGPRHDVEQVQHGSLIGTAIFSLRWVIMMKYDYAVTRTDGCEK